MTIFTFPRRTLLAVVCLTAPLILTACGTPAIAGVPDSMTVYGNGKPIAQLPTTLPSGAMSGMDMGTTASGVSAATVSAAGTSAPAVVAGSITLTPTDYVLYNILYATGTAGGQASSATQAATAASTLPVTATAFPTVTAIPTEVSRPTSAATQPVSSGSGAVPAGTADVMAGLNAPLKGDPVSGKTIFNQIGCSGCHNVAADAVIVGPALKGVAVRAATRKPGYTAIAYLRESIMTPNAYVVPGFNAGIMPQTFSQQLTPQQIDDVVSYLLTLNN